MRDRPQVGVPEADGANPAVEAWFREVEEAASVRGRAGRGFPYEVLEGVGLSVWGVALGAVCVFALVLGLASLKPLETRGLLAAWWVSVALAGAGAWLAFRLAGDLALSETTEWSPEPPPPAEGDPALPR